MYNNKDNLLWQLAENQTTDKTKIGTIRSGTEDNGVSNSGPDPNPMANGAAIPQVSNLTMPLVGAPNLHSSSSASALVVSATTFVRKSSLMRRPKTEVWTVEREFSV